ncbi:hypothetical protein ACFXHA_03850 [Nocardia sp. NPDC059240]|uniref:DUF7373 family lipoprotein n=1 Tax=Nocardia sp. NPDC059240 TaxID=3346786 RepID=UPI0036AE3390
MRRLATTVRGRVAVAAPIVLMMVAATGCAVPGHAIGQYPAPASFDVGQYSVRPLDQPGGNESYGRVVESARMAEALVDPVDVDPSLSFQATVFAEQILPTPSRATLLLPAAARSVLEQNGMLAGCSIAGSDATQPGGDPQVGESRVLSVTLLRFPDDDAAQRAASGIDAADAAAHAGTVPVAIPDYAAAHAHRRPTVPTLSATIADGNYVVSLLVGERTPDLEALTGLAGKAFAAQLPRIRSFVATPREQIASLPLDRDGMLARMAPEAPGRWPYPVVLGKGDTDPGARWTSFAEVSGVVLGPRATRLWFGHDRVDDALEEAAIKGWSSVQRYSSPSAARRHVATSVAKELEDPQFHPVDGPAGVPDVVCVEDQHVAFDAMLRYDCRVLSGRYVAMLFGRDLAEVRQKATVQYGLLVNGR